MVKVYKSFLAFLEGRFIRIAAALLFLYLGYLLWSTAPSLEVAVTLCILALTVYLFAFEVFSLDATGIGVMILLGLWSWLGPALGVTAALVPAGELFSGFSSNAVVSIIAVMIIGASLDKTGVMTSVANTITRIGGNTERRIVPLTSGTVGMISGFMQNVGAAALFIPVISRISARTGLPASRLLMPMGFCAICGGTLTMVGSSPLILLNDLLLSSNRSLPAEQQMETFGLFAVAPIGVVILASAILYFAFAGRRVLPAVKAGAIEAMGTIEYIRKTYGIHYALYEVRVPAESDLIGDLVGAVEKTFVMRIVGVHDGKKVRLGPGGLSRDTAIGAGNVLAVMASEYAMKKFNEERAAVVEPQLRVFSDYLTQTKAGVAEIVIPPGSRYIGPTIGESWLRKDHGLTVLAIHRLGETITENIIHIPLQSGDTLVCHTSWESLQRVERDRNFVVVTTEYPKEELRPKKVGHALAFFLLALGLVIFTDLRLSVALMAGAIGMILTGVLKIEEAYSAVSWKTVFLLASLIPLGLAVEHTGAAQWIAAHILHTLGAVPLWVLLAVIAVLSTFFSLVMSNVGATVLLVPLAVNIAVAGGGDPAIFAVTVALATSNSFLIPTHQVNALIMGPGGYRVADYMRAGGAMTLIFLAVMLVMVNLVF